MASEEGGSGSQFSQLLSAIEANVDAKLSQMKRDLREERETSDERLIIKENTSRQEADVHEEFNEQVRDKVQSAAAALEQRTPAVEKAHPLLKVGEKLIDVRQKIIKIADRSERGWATVSEYEEDELAGNSEDEKRLFRAEARAGRKLKQKNADERKTQQSGGARKPLRAS